MGLDSQVYIREIEISQHEPVESAGGERFIALTALFSIILTTMLFG